MTRPGRPSIGERTTVTLPADALELVDRIAEREGLKQSEVLRWIIDTGLPIVAGSRSLGYCVVGPRDSEGQRALTSVCNRVAQGPDGYRTPSSPSSDPDWQLPPQRVTA